MIRRTLILLTSIFFLSSISVYGNCKTDAAILNSVGEAAIATNHFANAIDKLSESVILDPTQERAKKNLATAHFFYGCYLGKKSLKRLIMELHQSLRFHVTKAAQASLQKVAIKMGLNPASSADRADLGDYSVVIGDLSGAVYEYNESLKLRDSLRIRRRLADVRNKISARQKAILSLDLLVLQLNSETSKTVDFDEINARRLASEIGRVYEQIDDYFADAVELAGLRIATDKLSYAAGKFLHVHICSEHRRIAEPPVLRDEEIPSLIDEESDESQYILTSEDLKFGEKQLKQMLIDRPEMAVYIRQGDRVWNWCVRQFAGECTPVRYLWCDTVSNIVGLPGWHGLPGIRKTGLIGVQPFMKEKPSGDNYWSSLIFELFNIRNDTKFVKIDSTKQNHQQWLQEQARLEYKIVSRVRKFYSSIWIPHCNRLGVSTSGNNWYTDFPPTFEEWFKSLPLNSPYLKLYGGVDSE